ncbi:MAG TPA: sugar ABC transporter substrate-binding protein [Atribacteraceae bacterium]|nr:sugar ABC transporter substrate-binding protein [Atribacteraceae bacterium]
MKVSKLFLAILLTVVFLAGSVALAEENPYATFEMFREAALAGEPYPGLPGEGKRLGFANIFATLPFCISVEQNIIKQARLAGFADNDMIILDNQYDSVIALRNADIMLARRPDVFIQFQADAKVNNIVAARFRAANIPIVAIDVPVPGAPFMGADNWAVATMGGQKMADLIESELGGWDNLDLVVLLQMPAGGEVTMLRSEGFAHALTERFGPEAEEKIIRVDGGMGQTEQAKVAMDDVMAAHPGAQTIAIASINEQTMAGAIASLQGAGRWDPNKTIIVTMGADELGQSQLREGLTDAAIAFFPEKYGEYVVPAAAAMMLGQPVPPYIFVENAVITMDNIDQFYPLD